MIVHNLHTRGYKIKLHLKNANFSRITAKEVILICDFSQSLREDKKLFKICQENDRTILKFHLYLKDSQNELLKLEISKEENSNQQSKTKKRRQDCFTVLKREFPTIFNLKTIKKMNWQTEMNKTHYHTIIDAIKQIFPGNEEVLQQNIQINQLKLEKSSHSSDFESS